MDAIASLPVETCIIDGEAIVVDQTGLAIFDLLRYRRHDHAATLCAFDIIELDGADLRRSPIEERKQHLAWTIRKRASCRSSLARLIVPAAPTNGSR